MEIELLMLMAFLLFYSPALWLFGFNWAAADVQNVIYITLERLSLVSIAVNSIEFAWRPLVRHFTRA